MLACVMLFWRDNFDFPPITLLLAKVQALMKLPYDQLSMVKIFFMESSCRHVQKLIYPHLAPFPLS